MVTITNDKETKVVTKGAYNSFYKPLGFNIIDVKQSTKTVKDENESKKVKNDIDDKEITDIDNKKMNDISRYGKPTGNKRK